MTKHFENEIEKLKKRTLELGSLAESRVFKAVKAVSDRDINLAVQIIESDHVIDSMEVELEEECLKILALYHPVAGDLRLVIAILKINNDLERIGDIAVNIASRAKALSALVPVAAPFDFAEMSSKVKWMLRKCLEAVVSLDGNLAKKVCESDVEIDRMYQDAFKQAQQEITKNVSTVEANILYVSVARHLERIADHTTNICEDVMYMIHGEIVRHGLSRMESNL